MDDKHITELIKSAKQSPANVRYNNLVKICEFYFGKGRQYGTSHRIYKTPWAGDPRVNIQQGNSGKAKIYQVKQVLGAIEKLIGIYYDKS